MSRQKAFVNNAMGMALGTQEDNFFKALDDESTVMLTQGPRIANTYLRKLTPEQVQSQPDLKPMC